MQTHTTKDYYGNDVTLSVPESAADVTDTILEFAVETADLYFPEGKIEWEDVWDRMEGNLILANGSTLSMGNELDTPAMLKIKRYVNKVRRES
jgi:hypothetical protein